MKTIMEYLSTKVKTKPSNKFNFTDLYGSFEKIAKSEKEIDILTTMEDYYVSSDHVKKIFDFLFTLIENGYETVMQLDYKTYSTNDGKPIKFTETSKIITVSCYEADERFKNLSIDIYDFEHFQWYLIIMSIHEDKCILHELIETDFKHIKNDIENGSLDMEVPIYGKLTDADVKNVIKIFI
jgi:hypothetical protein